MKSITSRSLLHTFGWCVVLFLISAQGWGQSTGCIQGDCVNGQGTYTFANDDQYVGEWRDDKYHGQGTLTFANDDQYVGEFRADLFNGQGTYTFADGSVRRGRWANGEFLEPQQSLPQCPGSYATNWDNCLGTYYFPDGNQYIGEFRDGDFNGQGTYTLALSLIHI